MVTAMFSEIRQLRSERWDWPGYSLETCALSVVFIFWTLTRPGKKEKEGPRQGRFSKNNRVLVLKGARWPSRHKVSGASPRANTVMSAGARGMADNCVQGFELLVY